MVCVFIINKNKRTLLRRTWQTKYIPYPPINQDNLYYFENIELQKSFIYKNKVKANKKNILFVCRLSKIGGIETRFTKILDIVQQNFNVFILSPLDSYNYTDIIKLDDVFCYQTNFKRDPKTLVNFIRKIIALHNIDIMEFEYGHFWQLDYQELKISNTKLVGVFHHHLDFNHNLTINNHIKKEFHNFDAIIKIKENLGLPSHPNTHIIPNGVVEIKKYYQANNSKKCLIISRISKDKFKSITKFIEFAQQNNIKPILAGFKQDKKIIDKLKTTYNLNDDNFIGYINTLEHLKENYNEYLFICGVAQVPIEAIAFGFPCLTTSEFEKVVKGHFGLTFVKIQNWEKLYATNFGLVENNDGKEAKEDLHKIINHDLADFDLAEKTRDYIDINKIYSNYINILQNLMK
jgi:hypothetical protein